MKAGWMIPALMGAFVLSSAGMAAAAASLSNHGENESRIEMMPNSHCTNLERQFDEAIKRNPKTSDQVAEAEALRTQGVRLCASSNPQNGIVKLRSALRELGVTPRG